LLSFSELKQLSIKLILAFTSGVNLLLQLELIKLEAEGIEL
jgi:hypothetical protein